MLLNYADGHQQLLDAIINSKDVENVRALVEAGIDINETNSLGESALLVSGLSTGGGKGVPYDIFEYLVTHPSAQLNKYYYVHATNPYALGPHPYTTEHGSTSILNVVIKTGPNYNFEKPYAKLDLLLKLGVTITEREFREAEQQGSAVVNRLLTAGYQCTTCESDEVIASAAPNVSMIR